jgi:hypothetical protein
VDTDNARGFAQRELALTFTRRVVDESPLSGTARALAVHPGYVPNTRQ